jgi:hypothetical protein
MPGPDFSPSVPRTPISRGNKIKLYSIFNLAARALALLGGDCRRLLFLACAGWVRLASFGDAHLSPAKLMLVRYA